jgi:membrane associated rhomboid family serine protease
MSRKVSAYEVIEKTLIPIFLIWVIFAFQTWGMIDFNLLKTSHNTGLYTIITGSFLHGDIGHIAGNTIPLLVGLAVLAEYYNRHYWKVLIVGTLFPGIIMYFTGHISLGISGLCYAVVFFVMVMGIGSKNKHKFLISIVMFLIYGGLLKGATTLAGYNVAWQSHLSGIICGVILALQAIRKKRKK